MWWVVCPSSERILVGEGNLNMFEIMKTLREMEFQGFLIDDHVPVMSNDERWNSRSQAFANGQMTAMLEILNSS